MLQENDIQLVPSGERRTGEAADLRAAAHHGLIEKADAAVRRRQRADDGKAADADRPGEGRRAVAHLHQLALEDAARAGAGLPQQERLAQQLLRRDAPSGKAVPGRADADIRLLPQQEAVIAALVENALHDHKIQLPRLELPEQARRVVHGELQLVLRRADKAADGGREDIVADGLRRADAENFARSGVQRTLQLLLLIALRDGEDLQRAAGGGLPQFPPVIGKQADAVGRLQRLDLLRHGGLRQVQRLSRAAVIHRLADSQKCLEPPVHECPP